MKPVELKTAYHWNCEECGADNFAVAIKEEFGPGEREEAFRDYHGLASYEVLPDNWEHFEMVSIPEKVKCKGCQSEFATVHELEDKSGL